MQDRSHKRWRVFWCCAGFLSFGWCLARAAPILMDASVQFTIYDHTGTTALSDGSLVYIVGSVDSVNNGMDAFGPTNSLQANSVNGDDIILATVRIGDNVDPLTGMFQITFQYDASIANFVYIRFFETTNDPVTGFVYYGVSGIQTIPPPSFGVESVVFDPTTNLVASVATNFVVIPEPGTANLIVLMAGMAWAMRATVKGRKLAGISAAHGEQGS